MDTDYHDPESFDPIIPPHAVFIDRYLNLIDLDAMFAISENAIILNKIDASSPDYVTLRNSRVFARAGALNFVAHCDCGGLSGNLNVGQECHLCKSICRDDFSSDEQLEHNTWLSIPPCIPGVLHPIAYIVLSNWMSRKGSASYLDVIIDATEELPPELHGIVLGRGHTYLYENFDELMIQFLNYFRNVDKRPGSSKKKNADYIEQFILNYRSVMFCTRLPVMSNVLHSITSSDGGAKSRQYADSSLQVILDAATDLQHVEETTMKTRPKAVSEVVHRIYKTYITYIVDIAKTRLSSKNSLIRGHMLGTRLHFSLRTVIIPHQDRYDELYFPWGIAVNLLKLHILGRLMRKHNMTVGEATVRHVKSLIQHDPLIDQIMKDLIHECKPDFPGLPILFNRPPSIKRGAVQLLYCSRVKPELEDKTINISTLILRDPNADFDKLPCAA